MDWLINLVKEWVQAQGYLTTSYVDRGTTDGPDWTQANIICDSTWHDLDLKPIVPKGAKAVALSVRVAAGASLWHFLFQKKGNPGMWNVSVTATQVAGVEITGDMIVALDADAFIQYWATLGTWSNILITVKGWWF